MSSKYVFDQADSCYKNKFGMVVYCHAVGCEAPASELVGESELPLCGVCADIWHMGFRAGEEARKYGD